MVRSPCKLRSGKRLTNKATYSKEPERALSVNSDLTSDKAEMESTVEACLPQLFAKDDFLEKITAKLAGKLETVVQRAVATALEAVLSQVSALEKEVALLQKMVSVLDHCFRSRTDDLEQHQRHNNLRVFGIPETAGEDTDKLLVDMFREKLDFDMSAELQSAGGGDVMDCLIEHKNEPDVRSNYKCRSTIEHYQLVSLSDYHFTVKFKEACRIHVARYCPSVRTKSKVVECLSEIVRNDTLTDARHRIPRDCRQQLKTQLLQQRESVDLDTKLLEMCGLDIAKLCSNVKRENAQVLECLEEKKSNLSTGCRQRIFYIELQDLTDSSTDFSLLNTCKSMIRLYCQQYEKSQALTCLKKYKDEVSFESKCKQLVMRRMIEQTSDYRFNPLVAIGCRADIDKFCRDVVDLQPKDQELQGKVIKCLKVKFREGKLHSECEVQVANVLREAALDYKLNPLLKSLCQEEINKLCSDKDDGKGGMEECLKMSLMKGYITSRACKLEVAGLIEEAKADIHIDPILHKACALDLKKFCFDIEQGAGRHIQCLLDALAIHKYLQSDCQKMLQQRVEMFKNAEELRGQPQDVGELISQVTSSPSRRYFLLVMFSFVGMVFIMGMFLGRATRRTIMMKNK